MENETRQEVDSAVRDLVGLIRKTEDPKRACWSIQQYGGGPDESYVKANRAGVFLFAADLLEAGIAHPDKKGRISRSLDTVEQDGEVDLDYVEVIERKNEPSHASAISGKTQAIAAAILQIGLLLFLLLCLVLGFKSLVTGQW